MVALVAFFPLRTPWPTTWRMGRTESPGSNPEKEEKAICVLLVLTRER